MYASHDNVLTFSPNSVDRLPPQNMEAEEEILGGIMLDPDALARVCDRLVVEAFYVTAHKDIYQAALRLSAKGRPTDLPAITNWLIENDLLERIGGRNKLAMIIDRTVSSVNIDSLADLVMEKHYRRQMIKAGNEIAQSGYQQAVELDVSMKEAEQKIYALSQKQIGDRYQVSSGAEIALELFDDFASGETDGLKIGWYDLDALTGGFHDESLIVVAAESHMGKTHFMLSVAYEFMYKGKGVLYVTPEMSKKQITQRLLGRVSQVDPTELKANSTQHWEKIARGLEDISELPWEVFDHSAPTPNMINSAIKQADKRLKAKGFDGVGAVFVDYLQQLPLEHGGNLAFEIGKVTRQIREMAKDHRIPVFLGCQINRGNQQRDNKRPTRHDLRNSGEIYEVLDQLIMLYRNSMYSKDESDHTIELIVEKNRINGKLGTATMLCDLSTSRFFNMAR